MLFSSALFLYLFLPVCLTGYFIFKNTTYRNAWLLLCSLVFFAWGGVSYSIILIASIISNYFAGILINKYLGTNKAKIYLAIGVIINLLLLATFKYANFLITNLNDLFIGIKLPAINNPHIALPIGISFYTFHSLSYLVDIYRRDAKVQKKLIDLSLYISFFPQLIAGPIIRYHDIADQLRGRTHTLDKFVSGIERFIIGLGKKVLLANNFAILADNVFKTLPGSINAPVAWLGIICYTLQIYFDFSGYSDMAIGLARMFGFEFLENFNFPYIAKSIREFWRRWHISLSNWFRDYLYISLGGNRISVSRTYINLLIVFFLTGLWHGASWTFIAWGLFHGFFLVIERIGLDKVLAKLWQPVQNFYTLFIVIIGWVLFRSESFEYAFGYIKALFRFKFSVEEHSIFDRFITTDFYLVLCIGLLGAFGFFLFAHRTLKLLNNCMPGSFAQPIKFGYGLVKTMFLAFILIICTVYLLAGTYNPFIYYRF